MHPLCSRSSRERDAVDCVTINFPRALPFKTEKTAVCDEINTNYCTYVEKRVRCGIEPGAIKIRYQINFLFL